MGDFVILFLSLALLGVGWAFFRAQKRLAAQAPAPTKVILSTEQFKNIGELSVFRVYTKEIITKTDHAFGRFGKEYLRWLVSEKKLSMIFEFEINFVYDLNSPLLEISQVAEAKFAVKMPPCEHRFAILNISFYDEKNGKFMPFLLPDVLNSVFGSGFSEADKNSLIQEAINEAQNMSQKLIKQLESKIQKSAKDTLSTIAISFGARELEFEFNDKFSSQVA